MTTVSAGRECHLGGHQKRLDMLAQSERLTSDASSLEARSVILLLLLAAAYTEYSIASAVILTSMLS